jgi:hypothetical protein
MDAIGFLLVAFAGYLLTKSNRYSKYQYRQKRDTHQIVEHMWGSNAKTVTTVRNGRIVGHNVLPDNSSDSHFSVQPYKKKKR